MSKRHLLSILVVAFVAAGLGACKKKTAKAGDACKTEWATDCVDKSNALVCVSGKLEAIACRDVTGCMDMGDGNDNCSSGGHQVGKPCKEEGDPGCSADSKAMLKCNSKHWKKESDCRGQLGCVSNAHGAKCDEGTGNAGDPCTADNEGNAACTADGKTLLICHGGKMVVGATCKGMNGCRQMGTKLDCNETLADLGDPCEGYDGKYACASDKKTRLVCRGGKMVKDKVCKSCSVMIQDVQCP